MLNNNNFSVKAIVAKYVTAVKAEWKTTPEYKELSSPLSSVDLPSGIDFAYAPHQQLLAKLWSIVNGQPVEGQLLGELAHYIDFFKGDILTEQEFEYLVSNYKDTVNHIFTLSEEWLWREMSFWEFPEELCDLMTKLLDCENDDTIYIPLMEYGDLAVKFAQYKISGNICSPRIWAFCCIRLQANGIVYDIPYPEQGTMPQVSVPEPNSVDCIICDLSDPLLTMDNSISELYAALRPNGRMTVIVSAHTLGAMGENEQKFRKMIVRDKSLEAIVQLPSDIFRKSNDSFFVMCIDKKEKASEYDGVVMADATIATREYGVKSNLKRLDVDRFVEAVQHRDDVKENAEVCKRIPYDKVDADILLPVHYLVEKPKLAMGLNKVLTVADLDANATKGILPAVTVKDLSTSFENANISVSDLSPVCDCGKKEDFAVFTVPCVFMCSNGEKVLVGYMSEVPETGIAVSSRINCFNTVNADVASATLLLLENYVVKQIKAMSVGKLMRKFDNKLLSKIKVLPLVYDEEVNWEIELEEILKQQEAEDVALQLDFQTAVEEQELHDIAFKISLEAEAREQELQDIAFKASLEAQAREEELQDAAFEASLEAQAREEELQDAAFEASLEDQAREEELQDIAFEASLEELKRTSLQQRDRMQKKLYETIEQQKQDGVTQYEQYRKAVRLRKHALTQSLSSFGSMFKALMNCRRRQSGFLDDSDKLSEISDLTVADAFSYLESRLESIQFKLAAIADVEEDFGKPEYIEPIEFINSYIQSNQAGWLNFIAITGWEDFITNRASKDIPSPDGEGFVIRKGEPINSLYFPKKALTRIFDNIIANAVAHGFKDPQNKDYKVRFSWEATGMDIVLTIENNGKPIPNEVDTSNILEYGFSTSLNTNGHNGIGCSEIASIMKEYDGGVTVVSTPNERFTVKYVLTFKRTNTVLSL